MGLQDKHQTRRASPDKNTDMEHIAYQENNGPRPALQKTRQTSDDKRRPGLQDKHQMKRANPEKSPDMEHIAYKN